MGQEEQLLAAHIREAFRDAWTALVRAADSTRMSLADIEEVGGDFDRSHDVLEYYIDRLFRDIDALGERLRLHGFCTDLRNERERLRPTFRQVSRDPEDMEPFSESLRVARRFYDTLASIVEGTSITGLSVFRNILENSAVIISDRGKSAHKEKEVERAVFQVVRYAFHDALSQPTINKVLKNYKPDFGVPSLSAAVELKFAKNETGVRSVLDGIRADMQGYAGDYRWRTFFGVIYTTDYTLHPKRLEADFRLSKAGLEWIPLVVQAKSLTRPSGCD